ncbi:chemotaxis protein CheA [Idiomarina seosinensis]|uniref:chemotaxis protein CheA n=1 Tax=Idiomarina seosinensis TaxID=281739 RepID=UPI0038517A4E
MSIDPVIIFKEEAYEHLENLENALLVLEESPRDAEQIAAAFRAMHTIKGSAGMVGFDHLSYFTHHIESFFERVRSGELMLNEEHIRATLLAKDHIELLLEKTPPSKESMAVSETLIQQFRRWADLPTESLAAKSTAATSANIETEQRILKITIKPSKECFKDGFDLLPVMRELSALGSCHSSAHFNKALTFDSADDYRDIDIFDCHFFLTVLLATEASQSSIDDVFLFVADDWSILTEKLDPDEAYRLGDLLLAEGAINQQQLNSILQQQPKLGEVLSGSGAAAQEEVEQALEQQKFLRSQQQAQQSRSVPSIKVPQPKLDALMDKVGELVTLQSFLEQKARELSDEGLNTIAENLMQLSSDLRETVFDIRMLPIGTLFGRFRRVVRDLSHELGKSIQFVTEGAETELDKVMLDKLGDPLIHLLRNSLDHGIEKPEQRTANGKPEQATITLAASHNQGQILIKVKDDGAGINTQKVRQKAIDKGLISATDDLTENQVHQLIFEAGFSTAETVSDVSGRGVGMDVVRTSIDSLQGKIHIKSESGKGTEIQILLPMTLAIIDGLLVNVAGESFVIPLNIVNECIETYASEKCVERDTTLVKHRGALVPCVSLRKMFALAGIAPAIEQSVIVKVGEETGAITVDEVVGQFQTVIKNLGQLYRGASGVMGATVLGDGSIAMVLDVSELLESIQS